MAFSCEERLYVPGGAGDVLALAEIECLALGDPEPDSAEGGQLELLAKLAEDYEKARFPFRQPDPIEAIEFRIQEKSRSAGVSGRGTRVATRAKTSRVTLTRANPQATKGKKGPRGPR